MEKAELWLARDYPTTGTNAYNLVLRNSKRALLAAGPLSFYAKAPREEPPSYKTECPYEPDVERED